jgi:hypothetical protein
VKKRFFFQMRVDEQFLQTLDDIRRWEPDTPQRTEMARRLLQEAVETRREKMKTKAA